MVMERVWIFLTLLAVVAVCYGQQTVCYSCSYSTFECLKGDCKDNDGGEGDEWCQDMSGEGNVTQNCRDGCMKTDVSYKQTSADKKIEIRGTYVTRNCAHALVNDGCENYVKYLDRTSPDWREDEDGKTFSDVKGDICKCAGNCKCAEDKCNRGSLLTVTAMTMTVMAIIAIYGK